MTDISALEAYAGQLSEAAALVTASAQTQRKIVNGDALTDVPTESGLVPTLAKQAVLAQAKVTASLAEVASQMAGAMTYANTALGLLGTNGGGYFSVPSPESSEYLILYKNAAGVAVETARYPSAAAVSGVSVRVSGLEPLVGSLDIRLGRNLYNNAKQVPGGSFNTATGGDTTPGGTWYRSEYIPVTAGETYKFSLAAVPVAANMSYAFYNANKGFIAGGGSANSLIAPAGAGYLRVTFNWGGAVTAIVAKTALPGAYVPYRFELTGTNSESPLYIVPSVLSETLKVSGAPMASGLSGLANYVGEKNASFIDTPTNLLDYGSRLVDKNINSGTGLEVAVPGWWATGFIAVADDGATYRGTTKSATINTMPQPQFSTQGFTGAWYDADKRWLAAIVNLNVLVAPAGAAYVRLSSNSASPEKVMFTKGAGLPIRYEPYHLSVALQRVQQALPPFWGKRWCALGDSFTFLNQYAAKVCEITGLQQTVNKGVSGQLLRTMADSVTAEELNGCDVCTLWGGTNNYGHGNYGLGTIADTKNTLSIYGDVRYLIDKILTLKPTINLFFVTPTNRGAFSSEPVPPALNGYGLSIQNIGQAMMDVCRELGVPCFDMGGNSGINPYTLTTYTGDNLHPNQLGADICGTQLGRFINSIGVAV